MSRCTHLRRDLVMTACAIAVTLMGGIRVIAQPPDDVSVDDVKLRAAVKRSLERGTDFLRSQQNANGSWTISGNRHTVGVTSLALLALLNSDIPPDAPEVQRGLTFLRELPLSAFKGQHSIYQTSLAVMALCAAEQLDQDLPRIQLLARLIENSQEIGGRADGYWDYFVREERGRTNTGDASNGQYAVLALRDAAYAGVEVSRDTWQRTHDRWLRDQQPDGGWGYGRSENDNTPRGSMTVAGLSTLAITSRMLEDDSDVDAQGRIDCCGIRPPNTAMDRGRQWMARNFSIATNPGGGFHFYYLYGLERAGRMSGVRFFGRYDWYREGARWLTAEQQVNGSWISRSGGEEGQPVVGTSMALMFLSKGLSRVVINKLDYSSTAGESRDDSEWNRHPFDVVNLVDLIDGLPGWPPRLISQVVTLSRLREATAVSELNQAPVLLITGRDAPKFTDEHVRWLKSYIDSGGFIFAVGNCDGQGFDASFRELIQRMFPAGEASLQPLPPEHPVFRSEYLLKSDGIRLWGVDFGCRTSIIYSPEDIGCLWQKWMKHEPDGRNINVSQQIARGTSIGVNVIAYATGREPPEKLNENVTRRTANDAVIERGLLQIGRLKHEGGWNTAPRALKNLLMAMRETVGVQTSTQADEIPITLEELTRFPLVYMHGRYGFRLQQQARDALKEYLSPERGGVMFADACCGSKRFDASFRDLMKQLYPETPLKPVPLDHELFSDAIGHSIKQVTVRRLIENRQNAALEMKTEVVPPLLEGIEIDGRFVVIYSRYDISCALEHQASLSCDGYVEADAAKIATNIVLYAMLQDIHWREMVIPADPSASP
jgi:hypothetical protein